jgi:hypothetical protein
MIKKWICILGLITLPFGVVLADEPEAPVDALTHVGYTDARLCPWWGWLTLNNGRRVWVCGEVPQRYALPHPRDLDRALHNLAQETADLRVRVKKLESKE